MTILEIGERVEQNKLGQIRKCYNDDECIGRVVEKISDNLYTVVLFSDGSMHRMESQSFKYRYNIGDDVFYNEKKSLFSPYVNDNNKFFGTIKEIKIDVPNNLNLYGIRTCINSTIYITESEIYNRRLKDRILKCRFCLTNNTNSNRCSNCGEQL